MPRYDYECQACGETAEADRPIACRNEGPACPDCGGPTELLVAGPMTIFKGAGWSSLTTQDKIRARAAAHAARGHELPPRARRRP